MKVLLFTNELKLGGSELVAILEANGLVKREIETKIIAAKGRPNKVLEQQHSIQGIVSYCNFPKLRLKNYKKIRSRLENLVSVVKDFSPDLIHSHGEVPDIFTLYLKFRLKKYKFIKYLRTSHNERYFSLKYGYILERIFNFFFNHIIVISQRTEKLNGKKKCSLILNPVRLSSAAIHRQQPKEIKVFGIIGRLSAQKNQVNFLQDFAKNVGPEWNGQIKLYGFDKSQFSKLEVPKYFWKNIQINGFLSDVDKLYDSVEAIIIPSIYEGMSTVMIEALSRDKFVFSTNVSGVKDLELITSKLKVFTNSVDLQNKIDATIQCRSKTEPSVLVEMFDPSVHVKNLVRLYREL